VTVVPDWALRGDLQVFARMNIIASTKSVSGSVNMRGGYSNHVFVAMYLYRRADAMAGDPRGVLLLSLFEVLAEDAGSWPHSE
jgi:hypothetical protein